ncbi:ATP-dependent Clp protease ATP-binding subunit ClpC [Candidatus Aerophobetes bacterium Ae_b3b]|nr:MAG: ATP-dependent Clp protease ATP-binding subunit ClpC [Candidatus Aerophobetes bacterium Ae_b3b]
MFSRFTEQAKRAILLAQEEANRLNHGYLGTEHILLGLIRENEGIAANVLKNSGIDLARVRQAVTNAVGRGQEASFLGQIPLTLRANKALQLAAKEARQLGHNYLGTEHLLLGLTKDKESLAAQILMGLGVDLDQLRQEVINQLGELPSSAAKVTGSSKTPALDRFGRDLTRLAKEGKLDPVIGREKEIERITQILCRRTKNNPVLIGEAGVGKTAVVEGLAQKIVEGSVPEVLLDKRVVTIELGGMVAGTKYRGEFEKRLELVLNEIRKVKNIILFVDEVHTLVGAGAAEGAIDASNMLKPSLARGEFQCIGATTLNEYRKYVEKDEALERRFQTVLVGEPTIEQTIEILKGLRPKYEEFHRVKIIDDALVAATNHSHRYIQGRFLPDKAIDVIDEAAARVRMRSGSSGQLKKIEKRLQEIEKEKQLAVKKQEFERAAHLRDEEKNLQQVVSKEKAQLQKGKGEKEKKPQVTPKDVAHIIASWTNIHVEDLTEAESTRLLGMEETLHKRIVGQDEAITALSQSIRRARAGVKNIKRPLGVFIFIGPTGVGKTYLARNLAQFLFGDEDALIRLDMSEYMERFNVSRLIGAPPGYVGYQEGGELTEKVRRRPYSVILLDEIEKAHPDVFNILLQVMEDGRLSDNLGHAVDFRNTVLIMTSNLATEQITTEGSLGFQAKNKAALSHQEIKSKVTSELKRNFRPEFLNRVDEVIVFHSLIKKEIKKILDLMLNEVKELLKEKEIKLELTEEAKDLIAKEGYDPDFGARPLRRAIQRLIENPLSEKILEGKFKQGDTVTVEIKEGNVVLKKKEELAGALSR